MKAGFFYIIFFQKQPPVIFYTAQKMKFFIEDFVSKCGQISKKLHNGKHFVQCYKNRCSKRFPQLHRKIFFTAKYEILKTVTKQPSVILQRNTKFWKPYPNSHPFLYNTNKKFRKLYPTAIRFFTTKQKILKTVSKRPSFFLQRNTRFGKLYTDRQPFIFTTKCKILRTVQKQTSVFIQQKRKV